jgi:hypothetical protein
LRTPDVAKEKGEMILKYNRRENREKVSGTQEEHRSSYTNQPVIESPIDFIGAISLEDGGQ